jgi:predicted transcriptional regulator of viral defense system
MAKDGVSKLLSSESPFFTITSLQALFGTTRASARTKASRLVERGILDRVSQNLYVLVNRKYSLFALANALHQPSVISLESALNYWGLIAQVPQTIFSISLSSREAEIDKTRLVYRKIKEPLFRFGQVKAGVFYIGERRKAFLDSLYLRAKGLIELLPGDVDMTKLDKEHLDFYGRQYPETVRKAVQFFSQQTYETK